MRKQLQHVGKQQWLKKPVLAGEYHQWLVDNGSLTLRLQQRHSNFRVQPLSMRYTKPLQDEGAFLQLKTAQKALVREVVLMSDHQPVVFAHSVLSTDRLHGKWLGFSRLGSQSLGAALFADPKVKRTPLSYKKISQQHMLYKQALTQIQIAPKFLWARRSVFSLHCANILVTEVFLPAILEK